MAGNANAIRGRDREEISMPLEADESKSEATSTAVSSNRAGSRFFLAMTGCLFPSGPRTRGHVKTRQHVNQFKAPAEIRRAARPAKLIALRALAPAARRAELPSSLGSRGLFKPAS